MNIYAEVLDIIFDRNYDAEAVVLELAKKHPALFLKIVRGEKPEVIDPEVQFKKDMQWFYDNQKIQFPQGSALVETIRKIRAEKGWSLYNAKHWFDSNIVK